MPSGLGKLSNVWRFSFNIYALAEASDFEFGTQLKFAKAHHKTPTRRKMGVDMVSWSFPKFGVSFNISAMAEASDFKLGIQLVFANQERG